ncbi:MAG: GlsB/YeaQ/YmgE family stress response membrane protein [Trueperaceae bacterium]|nr:GlsB/YeaQ/YmgE family stress response membrane protein [Trueperaceae bacterium]
MNFLLWIVLGAVAGWLASMVMKTRAEQGLLIDIVVGIVGALLGGWLFGLFGAQGVTGFNFYSLFVAFVGAVVLLAILRAVRR